MLGRKTKRTKEIPRQVCVIGDKFGSMEKILAWPIRTMELCILGLRRAGLVHDIGTIGTA